MPILNSSNPDDLQAQLANFLKMQEEQAKQNQNDAESNDMADDFAMPKITGRNIANNNRLRDSQSNGDKNPLSGRGKNKNKNASMDAEQDYGSVGFASMGSQLINNGQGVMLRQQMDQRLQMKKNGLGEKLNLFGSQQSGGFNVRG